MIPKRVTRFQKNSTDIFMAFRNRLHEYCDEIGVVRTFRPAMILSAAATNTMAGNVCVNDVRVMQEMTRRMPEMMTALITISNRSDMERMMDLNLTELAMLLDANRVYEIIHMAVAAHTR
ncbi:hypothetical protein HDR66_01435 [bacterium]|nr:hypothetical protein [bacterium]